MPFCLLGYESSYVSRTYKSIQIQHAATTDIHGLGVELKRIWIISADWDLSASRRDGTF